MCVSTSYSGWMNKRSNSRMGRLCPLLVYGPKNCLRTNTIEIGLDADQNKRSSNICAASVHVGTSCAHSAATVQRVLIIPLAMSPANDSTRHYLTCTLAGGFATSEPYQGERFTTALSLRRCRQMSSTRARKLLGHNARLEAPRGHRGFALA